MASESSDVLHPLSECTDRLRDCVAAAAQLLTELRRKRIDAKAVRASVVSIKVFLEECAQLEDEELQTHTGSLQMEAAALSKGLSAQVAALRQGESWQDDLCPPAVRVQRLCNEVVRTVEVVQIPTFQEMDASDAVNGTEHAVPDHGLESPTREAGSLTPWTTSSSPIGPLTPAIHPLPILPVQQLQSPATSSASASTHENRQHHHTVTQMEGWYGDDSDDSGVDDTCVRDQDRKCDPTHGPRGTHPSQHDATVSGHMEEQAAPSRVPAAVVHDVDVLVNSTSAHPTSPSGLQDAFPASAVEAGTVAVEDEATGSGEAEQEEEEEPPMPPEEFLCPVSWALMSDPVVIESGQTYERSIIVNWFLMGNRSCPVTGQKVNSCSVTPNWALKRLISQWCQQNGVEQPEQEQEGGEDDGNTTQGDTPAEAADQRSVDPATGPADSDDAQRTEDVSVDSVADAEGTGGLTNASNGALPPRDVITASVPARPPPGAILAAAEEHNLVALRRLIAAGGDVTEQDRQGQTALHFAAVHNSKPMIECLLRAGASTSTRNMYSLTPLMTAVLTHKNEAVETLLQNGASVFATCGSRGMPLHGAAAEGNLIALSLLLRWYAPLEACDENGNSPLALACKNRQAGAVRILLDAGASTETPNYSNYTPLYHAIVTNHLSIVHMLLDAGASGVCCVPPDTLHALHVAASEGLTDVTDILLSHPSFSQEVHRFDHFSLRLGSEMFPLWVVGTPLHAAACNGFLGTVQLLLQHDAAVDAHNRSHRMARGTTTPLMCAALFGHKEVVEALLDAGADPCFRDRFGYTALHSAVENGHEEVVNILLERGAKVCTAPPNNAMQQDEEAPGLPELAHTVLGPQTDDATSWTNVMVGMAESPAMGLAPQDGGGWASDAGSNREEIVDANPLVSTDMMVEIPHALVGMLGEEFGDTMDVCDTLTRAGERLIDAGTQYETAGVSGEVQHETTGRDEGASTVQGDLFETARDMTMDQAAEEVEVVHSDGSEQTGAEISNIEGTSAGSSTADGMASALPSTVVMDGSGLMDDVAVHFASPTWAQADGQDAHSVERASSISLPAEGVGEVFGIADATRTEATPSLEHRGCAVRNVDEKCIAVDNDLQDREGHADTIKPSESALSSTEALRTNGPWLLSCTAANTSTSAGVSDAEAAEPAAHGCPDGRYGVPDWCSDEEPEEEGRDLTVTCTDSSTQVTDAASDRDGLGTSSATNTDSEAEEEGNYHCLSPDLMRVRVTGDANASVTQHGSNDMGPGEQPYATDQPLQPGSALSASSSDDEFILLPPPPPSSPGRSSTWPGWGSAGAASCETSSSLDNLTPGIVHNTATACSSASSLPQPTTSQNTMTSSSNAGTSEGAGREVSLHQSAQDVDGAGANTARSNDSTQDGASSSRSNHRYCSVLGVAASKGNTKMVRLLLGAGAPADDFNPDSGLTPLHMACEAERRLQGSCAEVVKLLIQEGADPNAPAEPPGLGFRGRPRRPQPASTVDSANAVVPAPSEKSAWPLISPLQRAIRTGALEVIEVLLEGGAHLPPQVLHDLICPNPPGAGSGRRWGRAYRHRQDLGDLAHLLLRRGADVNYKNAAGRTPLLAAAWACAPDSCGHLIQVLLSQGADVLSRDTEGLSALDYATLCVNDRAAALLMSAGARPTMTTKFSTLLLLCVTDTYSRPMGDAEEEDVSNGGYPSMGVNLDGGFAEEKARSCRAARLAEVLLEEDVTTQLEHRAPGLGFTAIHAAAAGNNLTLVRTLVQRGADVNAQDHHGNTPLHYAAAICRGCTRMAQVLLELGADPHATNLRGLKPLHLLFASCIGAAALETPSKPDGTPPAAAAKSPVWLVSEVQAFVLLGGTTENFQAALELHRGLRELGVMMKDEYAIGPAFWFWGRRKRYRNSRRGSTWLDYDDSLDWGDEPFTPVKLAGTPGSLLAEFRSVSSLTSWTMLGLSSYAVCLLAGEWTISQLLPA